MTTTRIARESEPSASGPRRQTGPGVLMAVMLFVVGSSAALSIDVVRTGFGIKGDEATYVAMALSAAYDGDLVYEARDIKRFYELYNAGPEGIFLKRGANSRNLDDRLYFGKAYIYSVVAAPFVWLAGLNGLLVFHVVLLSGMFLFGYRFLIAHTPNRLVLPYVIGFFGVTVVPLYAVFLTSEIFNVSLVFYAYFLWFYKEVAPAEDDRVTRWLRGPWTEIAAAVLLGMATFSKPLNVLLILPPVLFALWRCRFRLGLVVGTTFVIVVAAGFAVNAAITGEFVYQGGDRKTFYGDFPFERPDAGFDTLGVTMATNEIVIEEPLGSVAFLTLLGSNLRYFFLGRHFGFLPFFFPGLVAVWLFLRYRKDRRPWQWIILGTVVAFAVSVVIYMPYTWSGGGGPPGNRYFLSIYPVLFFLTPPIISAAPVLTAWLGGALFTAHILINPFVSAKQPYLSVERGMLRMLPVELTMVNDLPINLDAPRARIEYGDPTVLLYYLDHNAYRPDQAGIWIAAQRRADIIVRSGPPLVDLKLTLRSPVANSVDVRLGGASRTVELEPGVSQSVSLKPVGVYARRSWAYLLSVRTENGFVPRLTEAGSSDGRYLGVILDLAATVGEDGTPSLRGW